MSQLQPSKVILISIGLFLLAGAGYYFFGGDRSTYVAATVLLRFEGINQGLYPDGSTFDPGDLMARPVLEEALKAMPSEAKKPRVTELGARLEVQGVTRQRLAPEPPLVQTTSKPVYPNEFRIILRRGEQLGLTLDQQKQLLDAIVTAFRKGYHAQIGLDVNSRGIYTTDQVLVFDYPFLASILLSQADAIGDQLQELEQRSKSFRSPTIGHSFADLRQELDNLRSASVGTVRSLVSTNRLVRNREKALQRYEEMIRQLDVERSKKDQEARYARDFLAEIDKQAPDVPNSAIGSNVAEVLIKQDYRTDLLQRTLAAGVEARRVEADIAAIRAELALLTQQDQVGPVQKQQAVSQVRSIIEAFQAKLRQFESMIQVMRTELLQQDMDKSVVLLQKPAAINGSPPDLREVALLFLSAGFLAGVSGLVLRSLGRHLMLKYALQMARRVEGLHG